MKSLPSAVALWGLVAVAVLCNVGAQLLIKRGAPATLLPLAHWFDARLLAAIVLYGLSFLLTALVYARLPLSLASPLMAGAVFVLVCLGANSLFGETLGPSRLIGIGLILAGIAVLAREL